jgi:spore coat polysaccharide biosynthesis protein SpsF
MTEPKVLAIIQARMSSSRLPGKVLRDLGGKPMLERVISRVSRARHINGLVVATTVDSTDDPIADFCAQHGTPVFRGSLYDVLDRYYQCALQNGADVIVRITADCPLIDPQEIDRVIAAFLEGDCDFAANRLPPPQKRTSPIGMDTEVCSFAALEQAWQNAAEKFEREHVMPYLYDTPGRFRVRVVETAPDMGNLRFTVDTEEDLQVARAIYAAFGNDDKFSLDEMLRLSAQNPQWQHSLVGVQHKSFLDVDERAAAQAQEPAPAGANNDDLPLPAKSQSAGAQSSPRCPLCGARHAKVLEKVSSFGFSVPYYHCKACRRSRLLRRNLPQTLPGDRGADPQRPATAKPARGESGAFFAFVLGESSQARTGYWRFQWAHAAGAARSVPGRSCGRGTRQCLPRAGGGRRLVHVPFAGNFAGESARTF